MKVLDEFAKRKQKQIDKQVERINGEQMKIDTIAEEEYRYHEERVWNENGEVGLEY